MITFIISAIKIIFLLGFLIFIHELGHFTVAKLCKVKVNEFAIGFGPVIFKKQGKETKYALRLFPLGGFVSMEGEDEESDDDRSFSKASIPRRLAIVFAGPIVNIVFATIVYFILATNAGPYISNEINTALDDYPAQTVGIQSGDKIVKIDNRNIRSKNDLDKVMKNNNGNEIVVTIKRNDDVLEYNIIPKEIKTKSTGIYLDDKCKIVAVEPGSSSEKQGIKANDKLVKVNNQEISEDRNKAIELITQKGINTMLLTVERDKEQINIEITPDYISNYYIGINLKQAEDNLINRWINGGMETKIFIISIIDNLKELFTGHVGVDQMMGPVGISETIVKTKGIEEFISLMSLISLSLGVTNLLPIPALDGGKILILLIEAVRRKPMKQETEIKIQLLGFSLLIVLSLYITYNDILRIF